MGSVLENLIMQDSDFSESKFKSKVENEFVQIKLSMVTGKTERIHHFVTDEIYNKIIAKVNDDINNNRIQIYDELNVANVQIVNIQELEDCFEIEVNVTSRALEYFIRRDNRKFLSGNNSYRIEKSNKLIFRKNKNVLDLGNARKCPSCGANMDINKNGICEYCGSVFTLQKYDWVITYMDV